MTYLFYIDQHGEGFVVIESDNRYDAMKLCVEKIGLLDLWEEYNRLDQSGDLDMMADEELDIISQIEEPLSCNDVSALVLENELALLLWEKP
jgi:hypothetical protein